MSAPIRSNTRAAWIAGNPILLAGEFGRESDTGNIKIGNGTQRWSQLPYHGCPGYWGSFWDSTSQYVATINTPTAILLRAVEQLWRCSCIRQSHHSAASWRL
jgi:hypothetical protein